MASRKTINRTLAPTLGAVAMAVAQIVAAPAPARATDLYEVAFLNACSEDVTLAVHHADADGAWISEGYFRIAPGEAQAIFASPVPRFGYYAFDAARSWRGNLVAPEPDGTAPLGYAEVTIPGAAPLQFTQRLTCTDSHGAPPTRQIRLRNTCDVPQTLAVRYRDTGGDWQMAAWYRLAPGAMAYLPLTAMDHFFLHAESDPFLRDGAEVRGLITGAEVFEVSGRARGFARVPISRHLTQVGC